MSSSHFLSTILNYHRQLWRVEASGIRTATAAVLPLIVGQVLGHPISGLTVGLGALYLSSTDKEGATPVSLLAATAGNAVATLAGVWIGSTGWPAIPAMFVWAFLGGMASAYGPVISQIGFVTTLVFAVSLGQISGVETGLMRMAEFIVGGLWGVAVTWVMWRLRRKTGEPQADDEVDRQPVPGDKAGLWVREKFAVSFASPSTVFRHAICLAVASALAIALSQMLRLGRGYWLIITVLVIVKPEFADTRKRAVERVLGSIAGGAVAALLAASIHNVIALDLLLLICSILAYSHVRHNYGFFVMFLTPFVVLMIEIVHPTDWKIVLTRIFNTLIGGLLALAVAFFLNPQPRDADSRSGTGGPPHAAQHAQQAHHE